MKATIALVAMVVCQAAQAKQPLLVISVDGLDQRYLAERDQRHLRIPHIRRLIQEGQMSAGVMGVVPTITWPSHTTLITGVDPTVHGILSNRRPKSEGGDYPWSAKLLKAPTLLDAAHKAGLKTATVTWPVTVDAPVDFNLPEYFRRRRGGAMDLRSIESAATPKDLVARITAQYPSFAQEWMDDRTRTQAIVYLLKQEKPDLLLVHLVDLDSEEHDNAPFTRESDAILEYTDELIGQMMDALPRGYAVALVSDHGFERVDRAVNLDAVAAEQNITGVRAMGTLAAAESQAASEFLRRISKDAKYGVGREIPKQEVKRFAPSLAKYDAVFEPAPGFIFERQSGQGHASTELFAAPKEIGNHGFWPTRYRAVYVMWGNGKSPGKLPELPMTQIAGQLAEVLGISMAESKP